MYIGGEGTTEVEYQYGKFVEISNDNIDAMNKGKLYSNIFQICIKENNYTVNEFLKEFLKVEIKKQDKKCQNGQC